MASLTLSSSSARARFGFLLTPNALFGLTVLSALVICGLFAPLLAPFDPAKQDLMRAMIAPQPDGPHLLGTDHVGRDLLSRLIYGARVSLLIAVAVVLFWRLRRGVGGARYRLHHVQADMHMHMVPVTGPRSPFDTTRHRN